MWCWSPHTHALRLMSLRQSFIQGSEAAGYDGINMHLHCSSCSIGTCIPQRVSGLRPQGMVGDILPFSSRPVDLFPPALCRLTEALGRRHAGVVPQSVGAFLLVENTPDGHNHLPMWALEVETLPVHVDPFIIISIVIGTVVIVTVLAPCHSHQRQEHTEKDEVHPEDVPGLEMPCWFVGLALLYRL